MTFRLMIDDYDTDNYVVLAVLIFYITEFLSDSNRPTYKSGTEHYFFRGISYVDLID
jgi:hypothetical protein